MSVASDPHAHEIIIVKHGGGDHEDGHHGGAWKIAFADFMTAMMCFFLVMWLINAANEETKVAVASYFNPVKLVDRNSAKRGLDSLGEGPQAADSSTQTSQEEAKKPAEEGPAKAGATEAQSTAEPSDTRNFTDEHLFKDPYAVLAEIVGETGTKQNTSAKGEGGAADAGPGTGASGGDAYRDPFAPDFWSQEVENRPEQQDASEAAAETDPLPDPVNEAVAGSAPAPNELAEAFPATGDAAEPSETAAGTLPDAGPLLETKPTEQEMAAAAERPRPEPAPEPTVDEQVAIEAKRIEARIREAIGVGDKMFGGISVVATERGVMISVTDQLNIGMFEIGSAVPRRQLVLAMEKISKVLKDEKGNIVVSGHTDGRPFTSKVYDNWRLSTARAQSAYYMLARAGLDERRIVEVSGFADRKLKAKDDPFSETNRRIEILLEAGG
jgi:chemotaxis protein MotB